MKKTYNKLVRDKIPQIIADSNKSSTTTILFDFQEYLWALKEKLIEEANEVKQATNHEMMTNELADCLEVIDAIMENCHISLEEVMKVKEEKANKNGKFDNRIYLISVDDKNNE